MSKGPLFGKFTSKEYEVELDKSLVTLLGNLATAEIVPFSVLGFPRFFPRGTYLQLCARHDIESSVIETFFQSYDRDKELYIAEPIRKVLRNIFARSLPPSIQSEDFDLVLSSFKERADSAEPNEKNKYQLEIVYLEYFLRPSWAITQYTNVYTIAASEASFMPLLRRLIRAFDDFRRDGLFASEYDLALHNAIRSTTDPWRTPVAERIPAISTVLDEKSSEYLHLHLTQELLKALIKKRDIEETLRVAARLEKNALKARLFDWQALAIRYQARANLLKDDYAACATSLDRARRVIAAHEPVNSLALIKVLEISADLFRVTSEFDRADSAIDTCIAFYKEHGYLSEYAQAVFKKAKIHYEEADGDRDSIVTQLQSVEPIFDKMGDPTGRGNVRNLHVACLLSKDDFRDEEIERLLESAQLDHQRGHSESGIINSLILRAKHQWLRGGNAVDKGLDFASEAIQRLEKAGADSTGLFNAHEVRAKLLLKAARFDDLKKELAELKTLDRILSHSPGSSRASSATRTLTIAELEGPTS